MSNKRWCYAVNFTEDHELKHSKDIMQVKLTDEMIEMLKEQEDHVLKAVYVEHRMVMYYFKTKRDATIYSSGLKNGLNMAHDPYKYWQSLLDGCIDQKMREYNDED